MERDSHEDERHHMDITPREVAETLSMVSEQNLDLRTITMGISLMGCADEDMDRICEKVYDKITHTAEHLVSTAEDLESEYGIPIANKRVSVTPIAQIAAACPAADLSPVAHPLRISDFRLLPGSTGRNFDAGQGSERGRSRFDRP